MSYDLSVQPAGFNSKISNKLEPTKEELSKAIKSLPAERLAELRNDVDYDRCDGSPRYTPASGDQPHANILDPFKDFLKYAVGCYPQHAN